MLVSVYLPTRNRVELLSRAVRSVLAQSHADLELIVVDDASTDATPAYLAELASRDERVRTYRTESPRGAPHARNLAVRAARGEWVTGLDDDDEFATTRLAASVAVAGALETAGVAFSALYTQDEVITARGTSVTNKPCCTRLEDLFRQNCMGNQVFVRKERLLDVGGYDEALPAWQDLDLAMRLVDRFGPARLIDAPLYRLHNDERPDRISRKSKRDIVTAWRTVAAKWNSQPQALRQQLYLQVLSVHYGFSVSWDDVRTYFTLGIAPSSLARWARLLNARRTIDSAAGS